jgi:hypothetical protein
MTTLSLESNRTRKSIVEETFWGIKSPLHFKGRFWDMKKHLILKSLLASVVFNGFSLFCCSQNDTRPALPPILKNFAENVSLYLTFEKDAPCLQIGPDTLKIQKSENFKTGAGRCGDACDLGRVVLKAPALVDFSGSGTVILWVSPTNWKGKKDKEMPYILPFSASNPQTTMLAGRQGETSKIYAHAMLPEKKKVHLPFYGMTTTWRDGSWHMLAVNWSPDSMGFSVDGSEFISQSLNSPLPGGAANTVIIGNNIGDSALPNLKVDEFAVLNKKLSGNEVKKIYNESTKLTGAVPSSQGTNPEKQ